MVGSGGMDGGRVIPLGNPRERLAARGRHTPLSRSIPLFPYVTDPTTKFVTRGPSCACNMHAPPQPGGEASTRRALALAGSHRSTPPRAVS